MRQNTAQGIVGEHSLPSSKNRETLQTFAKNHEGFALLYATLVRV